MPQGQSAECQCRFSCPRTWHSCRPSFKCHKNGRCPSNEMRVNCFLGLEPPLLKRQLAPERLVHSCTRVRRSRKIVKILHMRCFDLGTVHRMTCDQGLKTAALYFSQRPLKPTRIKLLRECNAFACVSVIHPNCDIKVLGFV